MSSRDQIYRDACRHYERGELNEAVELFSKVLDCFITSWEDEKKVKAHYYRGCAYYKLGIQYERNQMFEDSKENFEKALKNFEDSSKEHCKLILNKLKEFKSKYYNFLKKFCKNYQEIETSSKINEKFNNAFVDLKTKDEISNFKKNFEIFLEEFCKSFHKIVESNEIKKKFDDDLKEIEEIAKEIKVALAHPAASNGVCSRHRSGFTAIKNRIFSLADMLLFLPGFPGFEHSFL